MGLPSPLVHCSWIKPATMKGFIIFNISRSRVMKTCRSPKLPCYILHAVCQKALCFAGLGALLTIPLEPLFGSCIPSLFYLAIFIPSFFLTSHHCGVSFFDTTRSSSIHGLALGRLQQHHCYCHHIIICGRLLLSCFLSHHPGFHLALFSRFFRFVALCSGRLPPEGVAQYSATSNSIARCAEFKE